MRRKCSFLLTVIIVLPLLLMTTFFLSGHYSMWLELRGKPLLQAIYAEDVAAVQRHLSAGADIHEDYRDPYWEDVPRSALMLACEEGNVEIVRLLLDAGAQEEINCVDGWMNTPLSIAIQGRHQKVVELLLQSDADVDSTLDGQSMVKLAEAAGDADILWLVENASQKR